MTWQFWVGLSLLAVQSLMLGYLMGVVLDMRKERRRMEVLEKSLKDLLDRIEIHENVN